MSEWQPIESAPKISLSEHPVYVLLYGESIGVCTGRAGVHPDGYVFAGVSHINGNIANDYVTHWMPLPDPPVEAPKPQKHPSDCECESCVFEKYPPRKGPVEAPKEPT